jgi:ferredoxin
MAKTKKVIAPVAKKDKFIFQQIETPEEVRLDYDVTILPPKKEFFPPRQKLVEFSASGYKSAIHPEEKILLGVHFYDVKGIDMLDQLFSENNFDNNYMANRNTTTIIASNIQKISARGFWDSVGTEVKAKGHDAFMTKVNGGYVFETFTTKGDAAVKFGKFATATQAQIDEAKKLNDGVMGQCKERIKKSSSEVSTKVRANFKNEQLWEHLSKDCFSCGSCNIVCPTCYCFDVQDNWNIDQTSGVRYRQWDACLTEDFAKVSLGPTGHENFREERAERFRHRIMRKATYLNTKLGGPACTGCGRCSTSCVPDIADPVNAINKIMEA